MKPQYTKEDLENFAWMSDKSIHSKNIKDGCFICGFWFKNSWEHYEVYGNCCTTCSARIMRVLYCHKQRSKIPLARQESALLLAERRKWIISEQLNLPPHKRKKKNYSERVKKMIENRKNDGLSPTVKS